MPLYRVEFIDHGDNVYTTRYLECFHDDGAIAAARRLYVPSIGAGYEIWQDDRLVHRATKGAHGDCP